MAVSEALSVVLDNAKKCPIVDLRSPSSYEAGHLLGSCNIPITELTLRKMELPFRPLNQPPPLLCLVGSKEEDIQTASASLQSTGYASCSWVWQPELIKEQQYAEFVEIGAKSRRLWTPNMFLTRFIAEIESGLPVSSSQRRTALDLACGSGRFFPWPPIVITDYRDSAFLMERGWTVTAADCDSNLLTLASRLSLRVCPDRPLITRCMDLSNIAAVLQQFPPAHLVHVARYLDRDLLPVLEKLVLPGGYLVYHTFCEPSAGRPKKPKHLLKKDELLKSCVSNGAFTAICYEETRLEDNRPVQVLLARKQ